MTRSILLVHILFSIIVSYGQSAAASPGCEWCGMQDAPELLTSSIAIADKKEPGQRLTLSGTVFQGDGKTPASGIKLYMYHTNAKGVYPKRGDERGNGQRHGYLRGWLISDSRGRYTLHTIKPAGYIGREDPAHIHITVQEPGGQEYWVDSVWFEEDPRITAKMRKRLKNRGGPGIVSLKQDDNGRLHAKRDIILMEKDYAR